VISPKTIQKIQAMIQTAGLGVSIEGDYGISRQSVLFGMISEAYHELKKRKA
jgi:hypothetical protein